METKTRTQYSAKNTTVAVFSRICAILLGYVVRIVFTHTLNENYVGINGLFSDIINILSLTELGLGTAITYALYKPIEMSDIEKQKSLMQLFRTFYRVVAVAVLLIGLGLIPFMGKIIKDQPAVDHLMLIYILYLINAASSYLLIYKRTLIDTHQLSYIGTLYQTCCWMVQDVIQIFILLYTGNFILYLVTNLFAILTGNILISKKADKLYPFLKDKNVQPLPKEDKQEIFRNIKAMLMHKVSTVVVNNTDNLIISAFVGIVAVGRYSNYYLIIGSVQQLLNQVFTGIAASVGNLGAAEGRHRIKKVFEETFFITQWVYGLCAIILYQLLTLFVSFSFGDIYAFKNDVVLILCICFYVKGMRNATLVFRDSLGLFYYDRYKAVAEALLNLILSVAMVKILGVAGVFMGTLFSTLLTGFWVEPYILYKHRIGSSVGPYFAKYFVYVVVEVVCFFVTDYLCKMYAGGVIATMVVRGVISFVVPNVIMFLCYVRTKQFKESLERLKTLLNKH